MFDSNPNRRTVLKAIGGTAAVAAVPTSVQASDEKWRAVETPTEGTLHGTEATTNGYYAVGEGGIVIHRTNEGWKKVLDGGPTGNGNDLYGSDTTDYGTRMWFVGSSGVIGEYDVETGNLEDHSAPNDNTNNYNDVAVTGEGGSANVYVAGDSGKIYYSFENGESGTWEYVTPGSGSAIQSIDFHDDRSGHAVDSNGRVFETTDGMTWEPIGLQDANVNFYGVVSRSETAHQTESDDVDSDGRDGVWVSGGGGMVFHYDGSQWTSADTGDAGLQDVTITSGEGYTVGGGGKLYEYDGDQWTQADTPTGENLKAVLQSTTDIAVGAGGTVLEH
ncbi:WD40/YVTN/BNR-like repeat-containing protein [Halostella pelagica]|uniref:WD40/YVTN/BNR-like repeat-containing protein n=1 Tax=Halostella pelagica TaxID=2583824 RepID=UPI0010804AAB|nr:hypothetical protein [Halostella pelagica]